MFRINTAFQKLQDGASVTSAAFETGYESLSGFTDSFKTVFGVSPSQSRDRHVITLTRFESPLGTLLACAVKEGVCLLEFSDRRMLETELKLLAKMLNADILQGNHPHLGILRQQLGEYFTGKRKSFSVPLYTPGSAFQQKTWLALQDIPYGATSTYKKQALNITQPAAVRAVGHANGMNRISILVPCHRVLGDDGNLTGYGGGLWRKQWLLDFEKQNT
jgi:AraC family transcriptional regulator, regulatory protein of adaptative response / methylated-DNA-[protein]-cysteine methyltransferase